jgi:predicted homoserine dehydrogenase-like protein
VVTVAKRDLKAGERLDGIGGFCSYGLIDNIATARAMAALPIGLAEGCVLRRDISKDDVISFNDVESLRGRQVEALWREQNARWPLLTRSPQTPLTQQVPAPTIA